MRFLPTVLLSALIGLGSAVAEENEASQPGPRDYKVCEDVYVRPYTNLSFNGNEKKLICGVDDKPAWKKIPFNQARLLLRAFLQERGYHNPSFSTEGNRLVILPGEKTPVSSWKLDPESQNPPDLERKRKVVGETLTPGLLNRVEQWASLEMQRKGYPCPTTLARGFVKSQEIVLLAQSGPKHRYKNIEKDDIEDLEDGVLDRFYAFQIGDEYDWLLSRLSTQRMEEDGIVQSAHLISDCTDPNDFKLRQEVISGEPRVIRLGVGADTEGLVLGRGRLTFHRINTLGSKADIDLYASFIEQELKNSIDWYVIEPPSRWYLRPEVSFLHQDEDQYELISARAGIGPQLRWDFSLGRFQFGIGPEWSWTRTFEGSQEGDTYFLSGLIEFGLISHDFEFFRTSPRSGYSYTLSVRLNHDSAFSDATAQRISFQGENLWNLFDLSPPLLVLGTRYGFRTTLADRSDPSFAILPPQFLHFLGGSGDLRGFDRKEIPLETNSNRTGALTTAFVSFEARFVQILPFNVQPFFFVDLGAVGDKKADIDPPYFWNPGFGLRWESFIGVLRGTIAHGFLIQNDDPRNDDLSHFQFYFSFGEEF